MQSHSVATSRLPRRLRKRDFYRRRRLPAKPRRADPSASNPMHREVNDYLLYWRTMGYRDAGVLLRGKALRRFVAWAHALGIESVASVTPGLLDRYRLDVFEYRKADGAPLAMNTQQLLLVPVRGMFKWLARTRRLPSNPAAELELPRKPVRLPARVLTVSEAERAIHEADPSTPWGCRDRAILEVLYSTGMRRTELVSLSASDWNRETGTIAIRQGKGGRDRVVPIGARAAKWLGLYLDTVRPTLAREPDEGMLFLTDYSEPFCKNRLGDLVRRYLDWAAIDAPGSCHLFRHACATHMLENGADIRFIQALLGHADLRSTQIYTQVSITALSAVHRATHPAGVEAHTMSNQVRQEKRNNFDPIEVSMARRESIFKNSL